MAELIYLHIVIPQGKEEEMKMESRFQGLLINLRNTVYNERFSFEYFGYAQYTYFYIVCREKFKETIEGLVYSEFPDAEINTVQDYAQMYNPEKEGAAGATFKLQEKDIFPLRTFEQFEGDSMSRFFSVVSKIDSGEKIWTQIIVEPRDDTAWFHLSRKLLLWQHKLKKFFSVRDRLRKEGLKGIEQRRSDLAKQKEETMPFKVSLRCLYIAKNNDTARQKLEAVINSFYQFNDSDINSLIGVRQNRGVVDAYRSRTHANAYILSGREVATLFHFPNADHVPHIVHVLARRSDPPQDLPKIGEPDVCGFGITNYHNNFIPFGIKRDDRRRHLYIVGKSGSGKSKLIELLVINDIKEGEGFGVLDPHGDLVDAVMRYIPEERVKDVVLFDPSDSNYPIAFNPIEKVDEAYKMQLTIGFMDIFKKLFGSNWTYRLEHVLRYTTLALLDSPNTTVLSILKMLSDKNYRQKIVSRIQDNVVKSFWVSEFAAWSEKFDAEAITPLLNKVGQFVSTNMIRNIIGQPESSFNIRDIMDSKKILLMKVSKGLLGEENSSLIGSMIITKIYQASMERAAVREELRKDWYFYVDEFQNFATDTFYEILSEARKYHLALTIAHQYMGQLSSKIRETVFGNVGSMINFRVGAEDANVLEQEYNPIFKERDIINLGVREFYIKMQVDGEQREAFSGRTLNVPRVEKDFSQAIIENSRKNYCRPKKEVEEMLDRWDEAASKPPSKEEAMLVEQEFEEPLI